MNEIQLTEKFDRKIWKRFFSMLHKAKLPYIWLAVTLLLALTQSSISLIFPDYMAQMLRGDYRLELLMLVVAVLIATSVLEQLSSTTRLITEEIIDRNLQRSAVRKLLKIPVCEVERQNPRFFISRITTDTGKISTMLTQFVIRELPRRGGNCVICVSNAVQDTQHLERLFECGHSSKAAHEGIGLNSVMRILDLYKGSIYYELTGDRVKFVVRIPSRI